MRTSQRGTRVGSSLLERRGGGAEDRGGRSWKGAEEEDPTSFLTCMRWLALELESHDSF